jgi:hypothetical protein
MMLRKNKEASNIVAELLARYLPAGEAAHASGPSLVADRSSIGHLLIASFVGGHLAQESLTASLDHERGVHRILLS